MEEIFKKRVFDENYRLFNYQQMDDPSIRRKSAEEVFNEIINIPSAKKLLEMGVDNRAIQCLVYPIMKQDLTLRCSSYLNETIYLDVPKNENEKIKILILNANRDLSKYDLKKMGYKPDLYSKHWVETGELGDFFKEVKYEDVEKELLQYINEIEETLTREVRGTQRKLLHISIFKEHLLEK